MKIKLIYMGKRISDAGKLKQVFLAEDGEQMSFKGAILRVWVGSTYEATKTKNSVEIKRRPPSVEADDHKDADLWRAKEHAAMSEWKTNNLKKRADKTPGLFQDISTIKRFSKGLAPSEMRAFVEWVLDEVTREERERVSRLRSAAIQKALKRIKFKK